MDILSSIIKEKRDGSTAKEKPASAQRKKFLTRKQIEEKEHMEASNKQRRKDTSGTRETNNTVETGSSAQEEAFELPAEEVKERLRNRGHPVTLFGESDKQRLKRLQHVETTENDVDGLALQGAYAMRNTFLGKNGFLKKNLSKEKNEAGTGDEKATCRKQSEEAPAFPASASPSTANERKSKTESKEKHVYRWIKRMLSEWYEQLEARPEEEKRKAQGKLEVKSYNQCKDYIKPLQKKLKTKTLEATILFHLDKIVALCEERQYIKAADWYVRLAIGNAPWPIGVTMVGIHERSGRERIESSKVAHVMNDEEQRKYITSMKRLMTFCQNKYPTENSKMLL